MQHKKTDFDDHNSMWMCLCWASVGVRHIGMSSLASKSKGADCGMAAVVAIINRIVLRVHSEKLCHQHQGWMSDDHSQTCYLSQSLCICPYLQ